MLTKVCSKCGIEKPIKEFHKRKDSKDGHRGTCAECDCIRRKKYREENIEKERDRHIKYYYKNKEIINEKGKEYYKNNRDIILNKCKKHYLDNKDEITKRHKVYYEKNKEKVAAYHKQYYIDNKESINNKTKKYWHENKERLNAWQREYCKNNKDKFNSYNAKRRANISENTKVLTQEEQTLITEYYSTCQFLGTDKYHVDHIVPLHLGGLHHSSNLQILTVEDNLSKGAKLNYTYKHPRITLGE